MALHCRALPCLARKMQHKAMQSQVKPRRADPERTCIGCKRKGDQDSFLRVSRDSGGRVVVCEKGGIGRSAYMCRSAECIEAALSKERLARATRATLGEADKLGLKEELVCKLR